MIYRGAFFRNDETRYKSFLALLEKEVMNAGTLYPNDIVGRLSMQVLIMYGSQHR
jgi:hypothetical protein